MTTIKLCLKVLYKYTYTWHKGIKQTDMFKIWQHIKSFIRNDNPNAQIKWLLYGRVWREVGKPYSKWLACGILCTILVAAAEAFSITLVQGIIDKGFIEKNMDSLMFLGFQIILAYSAKGIFGYIKVLVMTKAGLFGITSLRRRIYAHLIKQSLRFFHETQSGALINSFSGLANAVLGLVTENVINVIHNVVTILMMAGLMFWYAPQMTAVLLILTPAIIIPLIIITRKRNILTRTGFGVEADSLTHITQSLEGIKTIQAFCMENHEVQKMNGIEDKRVRVHYKAARLSGMQTPILEIVISLGLCSALLVGGYFITNNSITTGDFTAFLLALTAAYKPAKALTKVNGGVQAGLIAAEGLFDFLDKKPEIMDNPNAVTLNRDPMNVEFNTVTFHYNKKDGNVLKGINLKVKQGQICAFVGQSGGGKTTIFNLLNRFYEAQQGTILLNGHDIKKVTLSSLRSNIATVSQDVFLFNGTIADNIKYGTPNATQAQIESAAKAAHAHDFIMDFPQKYNNFVGERGAMLSGGQKQRIAIARAILKDAPILLLDEATSALDTHSEKHIQEALKNLMKQRTTFVIAHRLTTILESDIICVIKNGQITEQGTDAELVAKKGEYYKLKDAQFYEN